MSAAAPRRPPGMAPVARQYLVLLGRSPGQLGMVLWFFVTLWIHLPNEDRYGPFAGTAMCLPLMFFLALFHWRGAAAADAREAALPVGGPAHARLRVACGAAWAAATLALPLAVSMAFSALAAHDPLGGDPWWHPPALLAGGLAAYLFGAAVWLRATRPGRVLLGAYLLLSLLPRGPMVLGRTKDVVRAAGWERGLGIPLAMLALAAAVAWIAAGERRLPRLFATGRPTRPLPAERRPGRVVAAGARRPPSLVAALRAEAGLMGERLRWPLFFGVLLAAQAAKQAAGASSAAGSVGEFTAIAMLAVVGFIWPALVWMDERGAALQHADALPVEMLRRRLLRVAVGAVWLEVLVGLVVAGSVAGALAAGTFASPADVPARTWAGIPCAVLLCYLASSLPALFQARNLVRAMLIWWFLLFPLLMSILFAGWKSPYAPWRVFTPLGLFVGESGLERQWAGAALVWLPITLALLVLAAVEGVRAARAQSPAAA